MIIQIKHFKAQNGERFSQLYKSPSDGFPLFYPTAYCTRNLRTGISHETQKDYLEAIKKLYEWLEQYKNPQTKKNIDIHDRLITKKFFALHEIELMSSYILLKKGNRNGECISGYKFNTWISVIARYMSWYAEEIITDSNKPETQTLIEKMKKTIISKKVGNTSKSRTEQRKLGKKLNDDARKELLELFENPFKGVRRAADFGSRIRNVLALRILYDTGMRIGELLGLRLGDFHIATGGDPSILEVKRYDDDLDDDRNKQTHAKTKERPLPIDEELSECIADYLKSWRSKVPNVGFKEKDFLFVNHRKGDNQGKAIEISTLESGLTKLKQQRPKLKLIHPHLFRHDWNYRYSIQAKKDGLSEIEERTTREFLMGWVENSKSAALYNKRRIQEQAFKLGIKVASHTSLRKRQNA